MERSPSNYRIYPLEMVERIQWIEEQKKSGKCLLEIVKLLENEKVEDKPPYEEINIHEIRLQMKKLEKDVTKMMETLDEQEKQNLKQKITPESVALMQSLIILIQ